MILLAALLFSFALTLVTWFGLVLFIPMAVIFVTKAILVSRRILTLEFVDVIEGRAGDAFDTKNDRKQRSWVGLSGTLVAMTVGALVVHAILGFMPDLEIPQIAFTYFGFSAVLMGGFLFLYFIALQTNRAFFRGLATIVITLPAFLIIVVAVSLVLSWLADVLKTLGLSAEGMTEAGFLFLYDVQKVLGDAAELFLQLDSLVIVASVVLAVLLLLLYTCTAPFYWLKSITLWLDIMYLIVILLSGAAIIFASTWMSDVQSWMADMQFSQLIEGIDTTILDQQAVSLSNYRSDELISLVKALVLPYTAGVIVARLGLAWRFSVAKEKSDVIVNKIAEEGTVDEQAFPEMEKRYFYYDGNRTLWIIALRSIGKQIELPQPLAPRALTIRERLTGELEEQPEST